MYKKEDIVRTLNEDLVNPKWTRDGITVSDTADIHLNAFVVGRAIVLDYATVGEGAYVGEYAVLRDCSKVMNNARVLGKSLVLNNALIDCHAQLYESATVQGNAQVLDDAVIAGAATITDNAVIHGMAVVQGCAHVGGNVRGWEGAIIAGNVTLTGNLLIRGNAIIEDVTDYCSAKLCGYHITMHKDKAMGIRITVHEFEKQVIESKVHSGTLKNWLDLYEKTTMENSFLFRSTTEGHGDKDLMKLVEHTQVRDLIKAMYKSFCQTLNKDGLSTEVLGKIDDNDKLVGPIQVLTVNK